jgi:hypothetical protein
LSTITGEVVRIFRNDNGTYNVKMNDDNVYGFYKNKPTFQEGDTVSFDYSKNGKWLNADAKTVSVVSAPAPGASVGSAAGPSNQDVIRYQAARNSALSFLDIAAREGAIKLGSKQADKFDELMNLLHSITDQFFEEANICGTLVRPWEQEGATNKFDGEE